MRHLRGYYDSMGRALEMLYRPEIMTLAADQDDPALEYDREVFDAAARWIHENGGFTPEMLNEQPARAALQETLRVIGGAVSSSITHEVPGQLTAALENNAFIFSGLKTYHTLKEVDLQLTDKDGAIKPFDTFAKDVERVYEKYNRNYLYAEYNHAVHASQMAVKWNDFEQDGDRYDLQYRTADDDKVRNEHAALHDTTLPPSDPFWNHYMPPNGWNCRCTVVQVLRDKYPASDSAQAIALGDRMTAEPKQQIFRFNPGKELKVFPDKHPYNKAPEQVKKIVSHLAKRVTNKSELEQEVQSLAENTDWFERGFNQLLTTNKKGVNGSTDMNGAIFLTSARMKNCIGGVDKLKRGEKITSIEADAIATLWHEITHNRNKLGNRPMSRDQTLIMEMANEFVARKTLPEFYQAFGQEIQHSDLMTYRESTGYNKMVCSYQKLVELTKADTSKVLKDVQKHLFEGEYTDQLTGLVDAITKNQSFTKSNGEKLGRQEITRLVKECQRSTEDGIKRTFDALTR